MKKYGAIIVTLVVAIGFGWAKYSSNDQSHAKQNVSAEIYQACMFENSGTLAVLRETVEYQGGNSQLFCQCMGYSVDNYVQTYGDIPKAGFNDKDFRERTGVQCMLRSK